VHELEAFATIQLEQATGEHERILEDGGIQLSDKQLEKQLIMWMLDEQVGDSNLFEICNPVERKALKQRHADFVSETKELQKMKAILRNNLDSEKALLQQAKKAEIKLKEDKRKRTKALGIPNPGGVEWLVEKVLERHSNLKPYYHGGEYNGRPWYPS